ncbi:hypothetical protein [Streptosporangium carneum]|uniref:Uncharacterized protein n=1 Tax=Streptosporangium carneum TaxID=47481 RepID=A0A9W6HY24_9ACTN|nr:hypothetical protein [Streptosporangium carneum]GLK08148.1 hypothetical protein GCM10017600_15530 [Streptosporangium carneum]
MEDVKSIPLGLMIPGWRVFLSDQGRFWASRVAPFTDAAFEAGAERTVDGDTLEELRVATARQEETAERATSAGRVAS